MLAVAAAQVDNHLAVAADAAAGVAKEDSQLGTQRCSGILDHSDTGLLPSDPAGCAKGPAGARELAHV